MLIFKNFKKLYMLIINFIKQEFDEMYKQTKVNFDNEKLYDIETLPA